MGTSFVEINQKGFWTRDSVLEVWVRLLALHLPEPSPDDPEAHFIYSLRNRWLLNSKGYFNGFICAGLDEVMESSSRRDQVIAAIESLVAVLQKAPKDLSKDVFNLLGNEGTVFREDIATESLLEIGSAFIDLINGKIDSDASLTSFMPGSKK